MRVFQNFFQLSARQRGFHLITNEVLEYCSNVESIEAGVFHLFIQHSSASLTVNENADPSVREDFESHFNKMVPEDEPHYTHTYEGSDDMPAHIKSSILGTSVSIPISSGRLALGTWQGICLCEHRDHATARSFVATISGKLFE